MTDINQGNDQYNASRPNWELVRDLVQGESAMKNHDLDQAGKTRVQSVQNINNFKLNELYLPMPDANNCDANNLLRYCQYVQRASLFGATSRTEQGMAGMVYSKPAEVELPGSVEYLDDDADGSDVGIIQQSTEVLNDILETGREGLLVDYPSTNGETTQSEMEEQGIRASIIVYKAESILDWMCERRGAKSVLTMVKLKEVVETRNESFTVEKSERIRILYINDQGNYEIKLFDDAEDSTQFTIIRPVDASQQPLKAIPFFFIGAINNRPNVDKAPLLTLAEVNLAHYRNSADQEESSFITGQPTIWVTGLNSAWAKEFMQDGIGMGARTGLLGPEGSAFGILQPDPNTMPAEGMTRKEKQMVELGARLIQPGGAAQTAEAARIKHGSDASVMTVIVNNIQQAYNDAIAVVMQFNTTAEQEYTFKLNNDFFEGKLTAQELAELVRSWQAGAISKAVLDQNLKCGGVIDEDVDLEEMNEEINQGATGVDFTE